MIRYIAQVYYYCRHRPATAIAVLIVALMVMSITVTAYKHSKHAGTLALIIMGADFILICTMIPALLTSGSAAAVAGYTDVYNQMGEEIAKNPTQQNQKLADWIYQKFREMGLPID